MPVPGVLLLLALLQESVPGLTLVLTANSEATATHQLEHALLKARLQYKTPDTILEVVGHTPDEIVKWKYETAATQLTQEQAGIAYEKSLQGRSGLLAGWVKLSDLDPSAIEREHAHLYGQLDLEYTTFSPKEKTAVAILAKHFPDAVGLSELSTQIGVNREDMVHVREQLVSAFAEDASAGLRLKRRSVFEYVLQKAGPSALKTSWQGSIGVGSSNNVGKGNQTMVYSASERLLAIENDLNRGAVQAAHDRIEVTLKLGTDNDSEKPTLLLHLADVHDQRGEYIEALTCLTDAFSLTKDTEEQRKIKLQVANIQFRLGKTTEALKALHWVRKKASVAGSIDASFYAVLRSISILIERDRTGAARRIAHSALGQRTKVQPSRKVDCHLKRIAARALVLSRDSQDLAQRLALEAFSIAELDLGERAIGNCQYCLGDVYRHRKEYKLAGVAYRAALAHASSNFDLKLYCLLGLAAMALTTSDDSELSACLIELAQLPIQDQSPERKVVGSYALAYLALGNVRMPYIEKFLQPVGTTGHARLWQNEMEVLLDKASNSIVSSAELRDQLSRVSIVL